ncbi:C4-dicarboxylate ABC transporter permease [Roseibium aquae]|uniref:TRAP transporter small permease protein n=1 Tax=Roseibium aquae TaxID=1323746 RepID=A0A916T6Z9_9HYPH|nr:TRAP transporter small permease [Roseibium aquae]GGB34016.1 C4-dicarboxylate ABC transporter permease [Roseibium aquae]
MASRNKIEEIRSARWALRILQSAAGALLFAMMVLTFIDVWGRYIFNSPLAGAFEITELMMATLIFAGLPLVTVQREHVSVDLLDFWMPKGLQIVRDNLINLLCAGMLGILSHRLWLKAVEQVSYGDQTAALNIPVAPVTFFMSFSTALSCAALLFMTAATLRDSFSSD